MLKKLLIFILSAVFMLFGCVPQNPPVPVLDFSAKICVKGEGESLSAELSSTSQGALFIHVTTPDEIAGLAYSFKDEMRMSFSGLEVKSTNDYLPSGNFAFVLKNVLDSLAKGVEFEGFRSTAAVFETETLGMKYEILTDDEGYIQNISDKELNIDIDFLYK